MPSKEASVFTEILRFISHEHSWVLTMPHSQQLNRSATGSATGSVTGALLQRSGSSSGANDSTPFPAQNRAHSLPYSNKDLPDAEQAPAQPVAAPASAPASALTSARTSVAITVAIPTYNGAERLPMVLEKLRSQKHLDGISWEIIVCDNSSTDDTATVVQQYQTDWPEQIPLHYRFAPEQGAAFARQRAVESAAGALIAFLDDDNLPAEDWLFQALTFAQSHPEAGAFGSQIHGQFESELPAELEHIKCFLAIIERGNDPHLYAPANKILPPAAGLVVRKSAWMSAVPKRLFLNNKGKEAGLASEDLEALLYIQKAGYDIWYNPAMVVHHDIPDGRLRKDYLVTLFRCVGLSRFHIRLLGLDKWKRPAAIPAYIANDICKLALHRLRYGAREQLSVTENCKRTLLASTAISPFFLLKKIYRDTVQAREDCRHIDRQRQLAQLTEAFEKDLFMLYQQPVVNVGLSADDLAQQPSHQRELLLRLRTQQRNCVLPDDFLPTARRYQLMRTVDRWVIRTLVSHVTQRFSSGELSAASTRSQPLYSINLSGQSVRDSKLAGFIANKLSQVNLPASWFCFEIDSECALSAPQCAVALINELHQIGCQVTLDNIIASPETTEQLRHLPVDYIKLDSAFLTSALQGNPRQDQQSVKTWMQIQSLIDRGAVAAIAKGIESEAQLDTVQRQGIRYVQGYKVARPQPL